MPGVNCAFFCCLTSRKHGIGLFKLPCPRADESEITRLKTNARESRLNLLLRTRQSTPELKVRIVKNNIYACERHFKPECIIECKHFLMNFVRVINVANILEQRAIHEY